MSRTKKGSKAPGYEYWGKRPMRGCNPGAWAKKVTHKIERQQGKDEARRAVQGKEASNADPV